MVMGQIVYSDHLCCVFLQWGHTPLHLAAQHNSNNVAITLLKNGANVNAVGHVSYYMYNCDNNVSVVGTN